MSKGDWQFKSRIEAAQDLDREGLLKLVTDLYEIFQCIDDAAEVDEQVAAAAENAAYDHFKAIGREWPEHQIDFGDYAAMLPLELERLRFLLAPFHGEPSDVQHAWIQTASGGVFFPLMPDPLDVKIEDIAAALSKICRFTGHTTEFYSVAEHSVRVAELLPPDLKFRGLVHDASEAYMNDISSPVKHSPAMWPYRRADAWLQKVIYLRFGISGDDPPELKAADRQLLATEARDLLVPHPTQWHKKYGEPLPAVIAPWSPEEAERRFLESFERYKPRGD